MEFLRSLRRLWRHPLFRRLLAVRVATQSADAVLQVGLASYVLFSPERQPDAGSVAAVLAITLLPFSLVGPFVGVVLDRWSRRQILVVLHLCRCGLALGLAGLVATGLRSAAVELAFYGVVLLAMSVHRFLLAALSAALPHTVEPGEYMVANSVMPTIGPLGAVVGIGFGAGLRLLLGTALPDFAADAVLFGVAGAGFLVSAWVALRIGRHQLGPDEPEPARLRDVVAGLAGALRHLAERREAGLALLTVFAHRVVYGIVTVAMILVFRNFLHVQADVAAALADLGLLAICTAAGFVAAAALTPPASARIGVRAVVVLAFAASAVFQLIPGAIFARAPLLAAGFLLGVTAQALKLCVDTVVQAHVADDVKGRVFVIYDMIFNVALVVAAGIAALVLPPDGRSVLVLAVLAGTYLLIGLAFAAASRGLHLDAGTESLRGAAGGSTARL